MTHQCVGDHPWWYGCNVPYPYPPPTYTSQTTWTGQICGMCGSMHSHGKCRTCEQAGKFDRLLELLERLVGDKKLPKEITK